MTRELTFGEASWVGDLRAEAFVGGGPERTVYDDPDPTFKARPVGFAAPCIECDPDVWEGDYA